MLMSKDQKRAAEEITSSSTFISKGTVIQGNIETPGNFRIEGKLTGNLISKAKVALGPVASIKGDIKAQNAEIDGTVDGNIEVGELITLKSTAVITGDITTSKLVVEPGAVFNGKCTMNTSRGSTPASNGHGATT